MDVCLHTSVRCMCMLTPHSRDHARYLHLYTIRMLCHPQTLPAVRYGQWLSVIFHQCSGSLRATESAAALDLVAHHVRDVMHIRFSRIETLGSKRMLLVSCLGLFPLVYVVPMGFTNPHQLTGIGVLCGA